MVGGLLMAVSAVGTFLAWQYAANRPESSYVVAAHPLEPGQPLTSEDVRLVPLTLGGDVASSSFSNVEAVAGRVTLGPVGEGELVQSTLLSDSAQGDSPMEVAFALPRDRAVDGRLRGGDRVDIFVTEGDRTDTVLEGVLVIAAADAGSSSVVPNGDVMVTVGLEDPSRRGELIHAVRVGEVTLVKSTRRGTEGDDR